MAEPNGKKVTSRQIAGQRGINLIEKIVLEMGWAWHPSNQSLDAGIDGIIEIRDAQTEIATNFILQVQSKVVSGVFTRETTTSFEYLCDERDLAYWLAGNAPVILIISRPDSDEAYWVPVKSYFANPETLRSRRALVDKQSQRFNVSCGSSLRTLAIPADSGIYLAPQPRKEKLYSNLLRIARFPDQVYVAPTDCRGPRDIWQRARTLGLSIGGEWVLKSKALLSFHDLRQHPWQEFCNQPVICANSSDWALAADEDRRREFVGLLNQCLRQRLYALDMLYYEAEEYYFFSPTPTLSERLLEYKSLVNETTRTVFQGYASRHDPARIAYYRHSAFAAQFRFYDGSWYLEITPTYHFTKDGKRTHPFREDLLSGIKRIEANGAVIGQVIMWAEYLSRPPTLFQAGSNFLTFDRLVTQELECGIDDKNWLKREEGERASNRERDMIHTMPLEFNP